MHAPVVPVSHVFVVSAMHVTVLSVLQVYVGSAMHVTVLSAFDVLRTLSEHVTAEMSRDLSIKLESASNVRVDSSTLVLTVLSKLNVDLSVWSFSSLVMSK